MYVLELGNNNYYCDGKDDERDILFCIVLIKLPRLIVSSWECDGTCMVSLLAGKLGMKEEWWKQ